MQQATLQQNAEILSLLVHALLSRLSLCDIKWHSERLHHSKDLATVVLMQNNHAKIIHDCDLCLQALVDMLPPLRPCR